MYRNNGVRVDVYNEGLRVMLYDESNLATVKSALAQSEQEGFQSPTLLSLAQSGTLVLFELIQDDPIDAEVALGEPLTAAEMKPAEWLPVKTARIDLPTGKLRVDSFSSFPDGTNQEPGAVVDLPKGKYELMLHRIDLAAMAEKEDDAYDDPEQVITLRPWPAGKKYRPQTAVLRCGDQRPAPWVNKYRIKGGVFNGQVISNRFDQIHHRLYLNLDMAAFKQLNLQRGMRLELAAAGRTYTLLCQGEMIPAVAASYLGEKEYENLAELHPMLLIGFLVTGFVPVEPPPVRDEHYLGYDFFVVSTLSPKSEAFTEADDAFNKLFRLEAGAAVELRVHKNPFIKMLKSREKAWRVEGKDLHCRVLSCSDERLLLNVGYQELRKIGFDRGDAMEMQIGDEHRVIFDASNRGGSWDGYLIKQLSILEPETPFTKKRPKKTVRKEKGNRMDFHPYYFKKPPLKLDFMKDPDDRKRSVLLLETAFGFMISRSRQINLDAEVGMPVVLRKMSLDV